MVGDSPGLFDDLERLGKWHGPVIAVNRAGLRYLNRIDFWCTYHVADMTGENWRGRRKAQGGNTNYKILTEKGLDVSISGSSSLLAALHGLTMFDGVVLAGCPLDTPAYSQYRIGWEAKSATLAGRAVSLSGWTKQFLEGLQ